MGILISQHLSDCDGSHRQRDPIPVVSQGITVTSLTVSARGYDIIPESAKPVLNRHSVFRERVYKWLPKMTEMPRGHIFQSVLFQSSSSFWTQQSHDPLNSTQMANANSGATCFRYMQRCYL